MTFFVVYVSTAHQLMSETELHALLEVCRHHNTKAGITGALLYYDGTFMQVLEGDQPRVEALYDTVAADPRHRDVTKIIDGITEQRQFADWSMAFRDLSPASQAGRPESDNAADHDNVGFSDFLMTRHHSPYGDTPSAAQCVLLSFRNTLTLRR